MAAHYFTTIENVVTGKPVASASIRVLDGLAGEGGAEITVYSDDGVTQATQPLLTDSAGFVEFWTNVSSGVLEISYGGEIKKEITDVEFLGGTIDSDVSTLLVRMDDVEAVTQDVMVAGLAALSDPNADSVVFWDDSGGALAFAPLAYRFGFFFTSTPTSSEVLCLHVAPVAFTFPANFATPSAQGNVGTNPTSSFAIDVKNNGTTIGTITISTGGAFTFATAGGTTKSVAAGDILKFIAPSSADATIANVAITLQGAY